MKSAVLVLALVVLLLLAGFVAATRGVDRWCRRVAGWDGVSCSWWAGLCLIGLGCVGSALAVVHDDEARAWLAVVLLVAGLVLVVPAGRELHARDLRARRRTAALWRELQEAEAVAAVRRELEARRATEIRAALPKARVVAFSRSGGARDSESIARCRPAGVPLSMDEGDLAYGSWGAE